jgi:hypothetical protein
MMSLSATLRRPDGGPLGSSEEIRREISSAFPDTVWMLVESPGVASENWRLPLLFRFWVALFGRQIGYPHYAGLHQNQSGGGAAEFRFETRAPIRKVHVTLYGRTGEWVSAAFNRLSTSTGWQVEYPPF